jgi:hypothetical protein
MRLFIRVQGNTIIDHPVMEENFVTVFPEIDINNLPANWRNFERVEAPIPGVYEVVESGEYVQIGEVVKNTWILRPMTLDEKNRKQEDSKRIFNNRFSTWTFDDSICNFVPPIPYPADQKPYEWDDSIRNWKPLLLPAVPDTPSP